MKWCNDKSKLKHESVYVVLTEYSMDICDIVIYIYLDNEETDFHVKYNGKGFYYWNDDYYVKSNENVEYWIEIEEPKF